MKQTKHQIIDNPIVYTYTRWDIDMDYSMEYIYDWLKPYGGYVGIAKTMKWPEMIMRHRVYVNLPADVLTLFILKFSPSRYSKKIKYKQ